MKQDTRIPGNPAPAVARGGLADGSININVHPWVKSDDYWPVCADLLEKIKPAFDENGMSIPYPQQDVSMHDVALELGPNNQAAAFKSSGANGS